MKTRFGKISFGLGICLFLFGIYLLSLRYDRTHLIARNTPSLQNVDTLSTRIYPVRIRIPSIGVDVPIIGSRIIDGEWQTTTQGVSYLETSPIPGFVGNSILYGHNWPVLLGNLPKISVGDKIIVSYLPNHTETFTVGLTARVSPKQVSILANTTDRRITIYTCDGFLDSERFVATAFLDAKHISLLPEY
jgi:LPXTG-site transpeptidase (sortase) family protein